MVFAAFVIADFAVSVAAPVAAFYVAFVVVFSLVGAISVVAAIALPLAAPALVAHVISEVLGSGRVCPTVGKRADLSSSFLASPPSRHRWRPLQALLLLLLSSSVLLVTFFPGHAYVMRSETPHG